MGFCVQESPLSMGIIGRKRTQTQTQWCLRVVIRSLCRHHSLRRILAQCYKQFILDGNLTTDLSFLLQSSTQTAISNLPEYSCQMGGSAKAPVAGVFSHST